MKKETWHQCHARHTAALEAGNTRRQHETWFPLRAAATEALQVESRNKDLEMIKSNSWISRARNVFGRAKL